jgi:asparagine synthase (glutamine-hydrolysing)
VIPPATRFSGCGIAGALHLYPGPRGARRPDVAAVHRMTTALAHRGPDDEGLWSGPGVILGHRRLSIVGLGAGGAQPMTRDHLTITYNGETYNAAALRAELARYYHFSSGTDTEVVLRAWQHWGTDALPRLHGMYAFAVWDDREGHLSLVRDRIGIKPLYVHHGDGFVVFASEVEALLASGHVPPRPDLDTLTRHLLCSSTLQVDRTRTAVADVHALPPGTCTTLHRDGRSQTLTYWAPPPTPTRAPPAKTRHAETLRGRLTVSVHDMLMGDVPVAALLSGGLDSSAICALALHTLPGGDTRSLSCVTTAYGDKHAQSVDEDLRHSRLLAAAYPDRIRHHIAYATHTPTLADVDAVCDLAAPGDDPRHPAILGNYQAVHELGLRVVLNGQGADEIMGGYVARPGFAEHHLSEPHQLGHTDMSLPASRQIPGLSPQVLRYREAAHEEVLAFGRSLAGPPLERAHRVLLHTQLARVLQFEDFLSMRVSVEARFPFLDHRIVEWAFTQPFHGHIHTSPGQLPRGKIHLTEAMRPLLPAALLARRKAVFPFPDATSAHAALAGVAIEHARELRQDPLLDHLLTVPRDVATATTTQLWTVLALWRWHERLRHIPVPVKGLAPEDHGDRCVQPT